MAKFNESRHVKTPLSIYIYSSIMFDMLDIAMYCCSPRYKILVRRSNIWIYCEILKFLLAFKFYFAASKEIKMHGRYIQKL